MRFTVIPWSSAVVVKWSKMGWDFPIFCQDSSIIFHYSGCFCFAVCLRLVFCCWFLLWAEQKVCSSARCSDCRRRPKSGRNDPHQRHQWIGTRLRLDQSSPAKSNQFPVGSLLFLFKSTENKTEFDDQIEILVGSNQPFHHVSLMFYSVIFFFTFNIYFSDLMFIPEYNPSKLIWNDWDFIPCTSNRRFTTF